MAIIHQVTSKVLDIFLNSLLILYIKILWGGGKWGSAEPLVSLAVI